MSAFDDTYVLIKAEVYADPGNSGDSLPVVYGDLTDGTTGNWKLPCIDTADYVYAYAGHAVMTTAQGNTITVYADDVEVTSGAYTFTASNNYESQGNIATIDFTSDQGNATITATGKGKADASGNLIENVVEIMYDFLTVENSFTDSDLDLTKRATASEVSETQNYKAAGVINSDQKIWKTLQEMIGTFLGYVYLDGNNLLAMNIYDGVAPTLSAAVRTKKGEISNLKAEQRLENLINHAPAYYAYSYQQKKYLSYTDEDTYVGTASQGIYGVQKPEKDFELLWCRDLTSVNAIQQLVTDRFSNPIWEIQYTDNSLKRLNMDIGDIIAISTDEIYDENENEWSDRLVEIIGINPNFKRAAVKFKVIDRGVSLT